MTMMAFNRTLQALLACLLLGNIHAPAKAEAVSSWLVLVVDRSGSISDDELRLQRNAYVEILRDPAMASVFTGARVAIVEFDNTSEIAVAWSTAASAAEEYAAFAPVAPRGGTAIGLGLKTALDLLEGKSGERIIDISGDGRDNRDQILLEETKTKAIGSDVEINGLVFEDRSKDRVGRYYRDKVITGFMVSVGELDDFADALRQKLRRELNLARLSLH